MSASCILIVEPDLLVRASLADYLRECGYQVFEAADANEARLILSEGPAPVDIILADVAAAGASGFELATWARTRHPGVEVVLAGTMAKTTEKAGDLCKDGAALSKPYDHKLVLSHIQRLLSARDRTKDDG